MGAHRLKYREKWRNFKIMKIKLKRVYEPPEKEDGFRILVDRLWPRGLSKDKARVDLWLKEIAPSDELRKDFHGEKLEWKEFKKQYLRELREKDEHLEVIKEKAKEGQVSLVYGAKNEEQNQAVVLLDVLEG